MNGADSDNRDLWVFGYGSLMWRPGFDYLEMRRGRLYGYHRAFCVYSWVHRGTRDQPGLVLGLDRGGSCVGRVFRVAAHQAAEVIRYLDAREMVTSVYHPIHCHVRTPQGMVTARSYVADRDHAQYAGKLDIETQACIVRHAVGQSGVNRDYVIHTVDHLEEIGILDGPLHRLRVQLETSSVGRGSHSRSSPADLIGGSMDSPVKPANDKED